MLEIYKTIQEKLKEAEKINNIKIPLSIESGSRAWGFPSEDSDYDCRFIYVHKKDYYITIQSKLDFINYEMNDVFDIVGWDLKKVIAHIFKSNASIFEWISSNEVYVINDEFKNELKNLCELCFNPLSISHQYLSLAINKWKEIRDEENSKLKKYFYILRPIANLLYIEKYKKMPPINYYNTIKQISINNEVLSEIYKLKTLKKHVTESYLIPKNEVLINYFISEITYFENYLKTLTHTKKNDYEYGDKIFRKLIELVNANE